MSDKLNIRNEMRNLDSKNRDFYQSLTDEERKKFSNYLMIRWGSAVDGPRDLQEYYVQSCNLQLNKHFFAVNKHPQLQWLMATAISPGTGNHNHPWIKPKSKPKVPPTRKTLSEMFPHLKDDDLDLLSAINDEKTIQAYVADHGNKK